MTASNVSHPYFPRSLVIPHYRPNTTPIYELLGLFFGLVTVVVLGTWLYAARRGFGLGTRAKLCWFVACGFIHLILEGYFSLFSASLAGEDTYLAQMWKEYGNGDSRYVTSDTCMVSMESITAFVDGPLCFLTAAAFLVQCLSPYRHVLQLAVSICQLYGDTLYYLTEIKEGFQHSDMWHPLYFWFYFMFLNSIWIIIPSINICHAVYELGNAQRKYKPLHLPNSKTQTKPKKQKKKYN